MKKLRAPIPIKHWCGGVAYLLAYGLEPGETLGIDHLTYPDGRQVLRSDEVKCAACGRGMLAEVGSILATATIAGILALQAEPTDQGGQS